MSESLLDYEVFKDIPGYKRILKAVIKSQIQLLIHQLSESTGEESVILSANVSEGIISHLGSEDGRSFLTENNDVKRMFLGHCLKRHKANRSQFLTNETSKRLSPFAWRSYTDPYSGRKRPSPYYMKNRRTTLKAPSKYTTALREKLLQSKEAEGKGNEGNEAIEELQPSEMQPPLNESGEDMSDEGYPSLEFPLAEDTFSQQPIKSDQVSNKRKSTMPSRRTNKIEPAGVSVSQPVFPHAEAVETMLIPTEPDDGDGNMMTDANADSPTLIDYSAIHTPKQPSWSSQRLCNLGLSDGSAAAGGMSVSDVTGSPSTRGYKRNDSPDHNSRSSTGAGKNYMKTPQVDGLMVSRGEGRYEKLIRCETCGKVCRTSNMARHKRRYCTGPPEVSIGSVVNKVTPANLTAGSNNEVVPVTMVMQNFDVQGGNSGIEMDGIPGMSENTIGMDGSTRQSDKIKTEKGYREITPEQNDGNLNSIFIKQEPL